MLTATVTREIAVTLKAEALTKSLHEEVDRMFVFFDAELPAISINYESFGPPMANTEAYMILFDNHPLAIGYEDVMCCGYQVSVNGYCRLCGDHAVYDGTALPKTPKYVAPES
jgi:hypothetical protein